RSVLESTPHAVLEGMLIAAYAVGAHVGFIYVRAEYPLAVKRLSQRRDSDRQPDPDPPDREHRGDLDPRGCRDLP
ncbi:MAG: hypothetical protein PHO87_06380, partial [Acholeplasmataceae bacterium]|nr:hypothetical protein [Acholeplasmataceae bacterium]